MTASARAKATAQAHAFVDTLFDGAPDGSLFVVSIAPKWHAPRFVTDPGGVVDYAVGTLDAYVRTTAVRARPKRGRAKDELTSALFGIALDLDVDGSPNGRDGVVQDAFADLHAARAACGVLLEPTLVVHSGYGLQPYWLFDEPVLVADDEGERDGARAILRGFRAALHAEVGVRKLDSVIDLSRVLRVPGSLNSKGERPAPVTLEVEDGPRHALEALAAIADWGACSVETNGARPRAATSSASAGAGRQADELLKRYPKLGKIARRELDEPPGDGSPSAWDFYLACEAIRRVRGPKATAAELEALVAHARSLHGDAKGERADYVARTVAAALERETGPPKTASAEALIKWVSGQWKADAADPIVAWKATGRGGGAVIRLKRRSGTVVRLRRLGDLYDAARHVEQVSIALGCRCPVLDKQTAVRIAQALGEACGVVDDPEQERVDVEDQLDVLAAHLGREGLGDPDDWTTLKEAADYMPTEKITTGLGSEFKPRRNPTPAERACAIREANGRLWLPAGPLRDHMHMHGVNVQGGRLRALMEEIGWEYRRVEMWEPGVPRADARHIVRVFYGSPREPAN